MRTIAKSVEIQGVPFLNKNNPIKAILHPRNVPGWKIVLPNGENCIASLQSLIYTENPIGNRQIILSTGRNKIRVVEHLQSLRYGLSLDAVEVELPNKKIPYFTNAHPFVEKVLPEIIDVDTRVLIYQGEPFSFSKGKTRLSYIPDPLDKLIVNVTVIYPQPVGTQSLQWLGDTESFVNLSQGRPFTWRPSHLFLLKIAKGLNIPMAILHDQFALNRNNYTKKKNIYDENGNSIDVAAHRLIDLLGILALLPGRLHGSISITYSSHIFERLLVENISRSLKKIDEA